MKKILISLALVIILIIAISAVAMGYPHAGPPGLSRRGAAVESQQTVAAPPFAALPFPFEVIAPPPQVVPTGPPSPVPPDHPLGFERGFERRGFEQWARTTPPWRR